MSDNVRKISIALLLLAGVWVAVYWLWEPGEGRISFSKVGAAGAAVVEADGLPADPSISEFQLTEPNPAGAGGDGSVRKDEAARGGEKSGVELAVGAHRGAAGPPPRAPVDVPPVGLDGKPIAVMPPEFAEYTVRAGDSLATISERVYGTRAHAAVVGRANPLMDPNRLRAGRVIRVPKDPKNVQGKPLPRPDPGSALDGSKDPKLASVEGARSYTVKPGDTLSGIAKEFYGSSALGEFLFDSNRAALTSPDELKVGMRLSIPPRPSAGAGDENRPR